VVPIGVLEGINQWRLAGGGVSVESHCGSREMDGRAVSIPVMPNNTLGRLKVAAYSVLLAVTNHASCKDKYSAYCRTVRTPSEYTTSTARPPVTTASPERRTKPISAPVEASRTMAMG
jgi:hypothetical protein